MSFLTIERVDNNRIIIALSQDDMKTLGLVFRKLDFENKLYKTLVDNLIDIAGKEVGFPIENKKMIIEFLPQNGGYVIFITLVSIRKKEKRKVYKIKGNGGPVIFFFSEIENLIAAIQRVREVYNSNLKSDLLLYNDYYFLILSPKTLLSGSLKFIFNEYGKNYEKGLLSAAKVYEHGKVIIKSNAIETIYKYFL